MLRQVVETPIEFRGLRVSVKRALSDPARHKAAKRAILDEIDNMMVGKVMHPMHLRDIPPEYREDILNAFMFLKDKFLANGDFDKTKARLVGNGSEQNPTTVGDTAAPTVNPISVMVQLNIAASQPDTVLSAYDIKSAFLITPMTSAQRVFIRIAADVAAIWAEAYPEVKPYITKNGTIYFELDHYLYGLQDAPHAFNSLLDARLRAMGFTPTLADKCMYTKRDVDGLLILSVHVDDLLLTAPSVRARRAFEHSLSKEFEVNTQRDNVSYLGMSIERNRNGGIEVRQPGYIKSILERCKCLHVPKPPATPAAPDLMEVDPDSPPCA
jgi:hypothetical protein